MGEGPHGFSREAGGPYNRWFAMLQRCYAPTSTRIANTYAGCTVGSEWHNFQNFANWFYEQKYHDRDGYQIDKDLITFGNREYSPENCCIIPAQLNYAIRSSFSATTGVRGVKPLPSGRFEARASREGKYVYLGVHETAEEAHHVWREAHCSFLTELGNSLLQTDQIEIETHTRISMFVTSLKQGSPS